MHFIFPNVLQCIFYWSNKLKYKSFITAMYICQVQSINQSIFRFKTSQKVIISSPFPWSSPQPQVVSNWYLCCTKHTEFCRERNVENQTCIRIWLRNIVLNISMLSIYLYISMFLFLNFKEKVIYPSWALTVFSHWTWIIAFWTSNIESSRLTYEGIIITVPILYDI